MITKSVDTYTVTLWMSGSADSAKELLRRYCRMGLIEPDVVVRIAE
jgi:hypothetical protein